MTIDTVIDCFSGVGGSTIALARCNKWKRVHAIEKDEASLKCAIHNAQIYEVEDKVTWHLGDFSKVLKGDLSELCQHSVIFASPPWGGKSLLQPPICMCLISIGPSYQSDPTFNLSTMQPYSLRNLMDNFSSLTQYVVLYLPRTSDVRQFTTFVKGAAKITIVHYCMEGASKVRRGRRLLLQRLILLRQCAYI